MEFQAIVTWNKKTDRYEVDGKSFRTYFFRSVKGDLKGRFFSEQDLDLDQKVTLKITNYQPKGDKKNNLRITYVGKA